MQGKETLAPSDKRGRIEKWDLLRALLIFLVVLGHVADQYVADSVRMRGLFLFIYSFHMPCFLFVDGLFSKRNVNEKRYQKIFSYLVMYIVAKMLISLVKGVCQQGFTFSLLSESGIPWYALTLFWCNLATIFLSKMSHRWVLIASVVLACFVGYDGNVGDTLVLMRTIVFFPFFFAGYCLEPEKVAEKLSSRWVRVCGLLLLAAVGLLFLTHTDDFYFLRSLLTGRNRFYSMGNAGQETLAYYGGLVRLGYYGVVALLCAALIALTPNHIPGGGAIAGVGRRSLQIYLLHRTLLVILYDILRLNERTAELGFSNLIAIPISLLITMFFALPFWEKPIRAVIYPKLHRPEGGADQSS